MKIIKLLLAILLAVNISLPIFAVGCAEDDKTAKVVVLLGQSNMEGLSDKNLLKNGVSAEKYDEYSKGYEDIKISYLSPSNPSQSSDNAFVPTALGQGCKKSCFGPEVGIAEYLSDKGYKEVFLVKYSCAGTSLFLNWRPPLSGNTGELYIGAADYVLNAVKTLEEAGYNPVIDAICWMQGESDADKTEYFAEQYYYLQNNFITNLRSAFADYANSEGIGFVDAGISDCPLWKYHKTVNDAKYKLSQFSELNIYFSTIDEKLEYMNEPSPVADIAHFDSLSEIKLGHLFGQNLERFLNRKI